MLTYCLGLGVAMAAMFFIGVLITIGLGTATLKLLETITSKVWP